MSAQGGLYLGVSAQGCLPEGGCPGGVCLGGVCPGGVCQDVGVSARGGGVCQGVGVSARGWGMSAWGVSDQGGCVSQHTLRQTPPMDRMIDRCKNITLPQLRCGR